MNTEHSALRVWFDGGSRGNPGPAAIGAVVETLATEPPTVLGVVSECIGSTTNNVAEYRAVIAGLQLAGTFGSDSIEIRGDSMLVIKQLAGEWRIKDAKLRPLALEARALIEKFSSVELAHVRREFNTDADALVNAALDASA